MQTGEYPYAFNKNIVLDERSIYSIDDFNVQKYLDEDFANIYKSSYRFAINYEVNINLNTFTFNEEKDFKVGYFKINVKNALGISLIFKNFNLPEGAKIFIFDEKKKYLLGAYTKENNKQTGVLPVRFVPSESIIIELQLPNGVDLEDDMFISDIGVAYRNIIDDSDWCEIDINCNDDERLQKLKKSTLKIVFQEDKSKAYYACTGTMVANTTFDNTPYFITANHCVNTETEANSTVFYFNYEKTECEGDIFFDDKTISGASLIATADEHLDFSLLLLSEIPPVEYEPFYAGWDRSEDYSDTSICIHHPAGDVKKISFDYDVLDLSSFRGYDANKHWKIVEWDEGTTEGGSSGSGLFTTEMLLIGDLSGGDASCDYNYNDVYQQFYHCWDDYNLPEKQLKSWLDPFDFEPSKMYGYDPYENIDLDVPVNFSLFLNDSVVNISWEKPASTPDKYFIYRNLELIEQVTSPQTIYDIISADGVYVYYATAIYGDEESKPSQMKSFVYGDTSSIPKVTEIRIYPNPTNNILNILTPDTIPIIKIEVYDPLGKMTRFYTVDEQRYTTIDLSGLENSYYFLKIYTIGDTYLEKIIFIREN